jgi:hypothetical protein
MSQHLEALALANDIRRRRAAQKRKLAELPYKSGRAVVVGIITSPGDLWKTAPLDYVLRMPRQHGTGFSVKMRRGINAKTVGALTDRQRDLLVARIESFGRGK